MTWHWPAGSIRTTGLAESSLDARIAPIYQKHKNVQTTILAKPGQVDVRLTAAGKTAAEAERAVQELAAKSRWNCATTSSPTRSNRLKKS